MKKTTVWLALLAFCGTNNSVAAENTNIFSIDTDSIKRYWDVDDTSHTITNKKLLQDGSQFDSDTLLKIFNDLDTVIKNNYKGYTINLGKKFLSHYQGKSIDLSPIAPHIRRISDYFLAEAYRLENFDTQGLINVTTIGHYFLNNAYNLTNFDTQGFINVKDIGVFFLNRAESLPTLDMQGFKNVIKIGKDFLHSARSLKELKGLSNVREIGNSFLVGAHSLQTLDTSGFTNVTELGNDFLVNAISLKEFNAQGLINVTKVGDDFLRNTLSLKEFDKSKLRLTKEGANFRSVAISTPHTVSIDTDSIERYWEVDVNSQTITNKTLLTDGRQFDSVTLLKIFTHLATVVNKSYNGYKIDLGEFFLSGYAGETIDFSPIAPYIHHIGDYFLNNAYRLTEFKTEKLINLKRIGGCFLNRAYSLKSLDTQVFTNVTKIGCSFMDYAESLEKLDMEGFRNVTVIGAKFLNDAKKLKTLINMKLLKEVKKIKYSFLRGAHSLQTLDTRGLTNVTEIENDFLAGAISLKEFNAQGLINVTKVGNNFLADAIPLKEFDAQGLINVIETGNNFLHRVLVEHIIVPSLYGVTPFLHHTLPSSSVLSSSLNNALNSFLSSRLKQYKVTIVSKPQDSPKTAHLKTPQRVAGLLDSNVEVSEKNSNKIRMKINVKKRIKKEFDKEQKLLDKTMALCGKQQSARNNAPGNVFVVTKEESKKEELMKKNSRDLADNPSVMDDESMEKKSVEILSFRPHNFFFRT